ncbi:hypothetical protein H8E77_22105 [bacterium]|nr:hypothetical protein [bacterium]
MKAEISKLLTKTRMSSSDIRDLIGLINVESANSVYRKCADEFNFRTVDLEGKLFSTATELAQPLGYRNLKSVSTVLRRNDVKSHAITRLHRFDVIIRQTFNLADNDHRTLLVDYQGFLTLALEGNGEHCDKVREYLLAMEEKARTDSVIYQETGLDTKDFSDVGEYLDDPTVVTMMESQRTMQELIKLRVQQLKTEKRVDALEAERARTTGFLDEVGNKLSVTDEQEHRLNMMRDELVHLKCENGWESKKAFGWFYNTVKDRFHIGVFRGLSREKFPLVTDWIEKQIVNERAKSAQLEMPGVTITLQA